ncbi:MAG: DUF4149 domain-containing protein [Mariprofundaceae bacterium]
MIPAKCLRAVAVNLALALIFGLLIVPGYVVVPVLFEYAENSTTAGMLAGHVFHLSNMGVLFLAAAVAAFWMRMSPQGRGRWILLCVMSLLIAVNEFSIAPLLATIKSEAGSIASLVEDDPLKAKFGMLHGISALCHLVASLLAVALVAMGRSGSGHCKTS